jgi:dihydrofolate synthase/folylpolyglutamate synthase
MGPHRALARARELAGDDGVVLATGSIYLISDLLRPEGAGGGSRL